MTPLLRGFAAFLLAILATATPGVAGDEPGNRLVLAATEVTAPWELSRAEASGTNEQRLASLNQDWLADKHPAP